MALATASTQALATGTRVPPGMRVKWYQRSWEVFIEVEGPDLESPAINISDDGLIVIHIFSAGVPQTVRLQLLHAVASSRSRRAGASTLPYQMWCEGRLIMSVGGLSARGVSSSSWPSRGNQGHTGIA